MNLGMTSTGFTVWFTGMSGAGKSTLAQGVAQRLRRLGQYPEILDGGEANEILQIGKAQTKDERNAEVRRLAWICKLVTKAGGIVIQSAIQSPYREARDEARRQIHRFAEVFVECPTDVLIARDRTGQYKKALSGELKNLPGISEPYEPPTHPEVVVDTSKQSIDEAVEHLVGQLVALRLLDPSTAGMKARPRVLARSKKEGGRESAFPPARNAPKAAPRPVLQAKAAPGVPVAKPASAPKTAPVPVKAALAVKSAPTPGKAKAASAARPTKAAKGEKARPKPKLVKPASHATKAAPSAKRGASMTKSRPAARTARAEPSRAAGDRKH